MFVDELQFQLLLFNIKNVSSNEIKRGYVCSDQTNDPAKEVEEFTA